MIQRHTILKNLSFSGNADTFIAPVSSMSTFGNYQINNIQGTGGGIVNSSNVRAFLNDDTSNEFIINDFFSYLTGNTTAVEFSEIYNSDNKLSETFNEYYQSSILNNQAPATSVINNNLTGTSGVTIVENGIHDYNGVAPGKGLTGITMSINNSTRKLNVYSALTTFTEEESYYIPVFIKRNSRQMARLTFEACDEKQSLILNTPLGDGGLNDGPVIDNSEENVNDFVPSGADNPGGEEPINEPNNESSISIGSFFIIQ